MQKRKIRRRTYRHISFGLPLPTLITSLLFFGPIVGLAGQQRGSRSVKSRVPAMTQAQQIQHALTRLGFGARPGDSEKVERSGVVAYLDQQLQPGAIDDSDLEKRLGRLPSLRLSLPAIAEVYNPPKPAVSPSPQPSPGPVPPAATNQVPVMNAQSPVLNTTAAEKTSLPQ